MELIIVSFVAGVLTVLAPCILPLLPVIIGGSINGQSKDYKKPFIIIASLAASLFLFTILLKVSTALLGVPSYVWQVLSGLIIVALGLTLVWPKLWEPIGAKLNLKSNKLLGKAGHNRGVFGDILTGAALGPVFSSCSPTYAFILAGVLPGSLAMGLTYLVAYVVGLSLILLLIALLGQQLVAKLNWAANPNGWFKRTLGIIFIMVGIFVMFSLDKQLQTYVLESGLYDWVSDFERTLFR